MIDRNYIDDNDLIERYVLGQLEETERQAFESHFALDDELIEEIHAAEALMLGLRAMARSHAGPPAMPDPFVGSTWRWVAGLALAAISLALLVHNLQLRDQLGLRGAQVSPRTIQLDLAGSPEWDAPRFAEDDGWNILLMPRRSLAGGEFRLRLLSGAGHEILSAPRFAPDPFSPWVEWLVPGNTLVPGRYLVELSRADGGVDKSLPFEICSSEAPDCRATTR